MTPPDASSRSAAHRPAAPGFPAFADTVQASARAEPLAGDALDVCHPGLALRAVLFVQAVLAAGALLRAGSWAEAAVLAGPALFTGLFGVLGWLMLICAAGRWLRHAPPLRRSAFAVLLGVGCALAAQALLWPVGLASAEPPRLLGVALAGALLAGCLWLWLLLRVRSRLPAEAAARLVELQSRIRPHFLFNALNTAIALVRIDPGRAEEVLEDLAQLFRVALEDHGQAVSLADEVDLARRYLAIEQLRFGERLRVRWELDARADSAQVPPLLLQPLVENAVRHGVEPSPAGGELVVRSAVRRGNAVIEIENSLSDGPSQPGHGIALRNVRERLALLHDVAAVFEARREGALYRVHIEVPLS